MNRVRVCISRTIATAAGAGVVTIAAVAVVVS